MTAPWSQGTLSDTLLYAGGNITNTNTHNHYGNNVFSGPDPLSRLLQHCALGALHDAAERPDPPRCHENTRIAVLDRIDRWVRDESVDAKPILWLKGAAGAGKSAIAQTLIERWRKENLVVPNFFFWRTAAQRNEKTCVVPTFAFQLAQFVPETGSIIEKATRNGSIFSKNILAQVEALIVNPLETVQESSHKVVIVLDGLDECCLDLPRTEHFPGQGHEDQQREILDAIAFACQKLPFLRVLLASRPERQIRKSFAGKSLATLSLPLSLTDYERDTEADITLYLNCEFAGIRSENPGINPSWPSREQINELVKKSSGQFIYPSTVIKYVSQPRRHPVVSLEEVLALRPQSANREGHPLAELDALYTLVLMTVSEDSLPIVRNVLGLMSYYPFPYFANSDRVHPFNIFPENMGPDYDTHHLESFLCLRTGELSTHLTDLHSILSISKHAQNGFIEIRFFHATFSEYLQDKYRSGDFYISHGHVHVQISLLLLRHASFEQQSNASVYSLSELYYALVIFVYGSPKSIDLMKGLWTFLKDDIGEYTMITGSALNLETSQKTHVGGHLKYFQGPISDHLPIHYRLWLLEYLLRCNVPEIELSEAHRQAVGGHLLFLRKLVDPDGTYTHGRYRRRIATQAQDTKENEKGPSLQPPHKQGKKKKSASRRLWSGLLIWFSFRGKKRTV